MELVCLLTIASYSSKLNSPAAFRASGRGYGRQNLPCSKGQTRQELLAFDGRHLPAWVSTICWEKGGCFQAFSQLVGKPVLKTSFDIITDKTGRIICPSLRPWSLFARKKVSKQALHSKHRCARPALKEPSKTVKRFCCCQWKKERKGGRQRRFI